MSKFLRAGIGVAALASVLAFTACGANTTSTANSSVTGVVNYALPVADSSPAAEPTAPAPVAGVTAIVDSYKADKAAGTPGVAVLTGFSTLYKPGANLNNGSILNASVMAYNNQYVVDLTRNRTTAQEVKAYLDDRRDQSYTVIEGLGPLASYYRSGAQATTTIPSWDTSTYNTEYDDSSASGDAGGVLTSPLGKVAALINNLRSFSTTPAKKAYLFARPFREDATGAVKDAGSATTMNGFTSSDGGATKSSWTRSFENYNSSVVVPPSLLPIRSTNPLTDYGFPSGHTNAAYLASLALAYAVPERYQEMLTRASELGENRIMAGMHSPLDVMGGRMMATAWAAAILYNNDMSNTSAPAISKADAYAQAHSYFLAQTGADANSLYAFAHSQNDVDDPWADWAADKREYKRRMSFGFPQIASTTATANVPKGAEALLETRQPYLSANQRRWALYTTAISSGYPLLDDAEGWGRLNLFDATQGGYNALDRWRNDIGGAGKLFKQGTGALRLSGANSYSGGTQIDGGSLYADSVLALGRGDVVINGGALYVDAPGVLVIPGGFNLVSGSLNLTLGANGSGSLAVSGMAGYAGALNVTIGSGFTPTSGSTVDLITHGNYTGAFSKVTVTGTTLAYSVAYDSKGVHLKFN